MRSSAILFLLILLSSVLTFGCRSGDTASDAGDEITERLTPVDVIVISTGDFRDVIELTGTVRAPDDATLAAEASGILTYLAPLGTFVQRGATVAQVASRTAQASVAQANATIAQARAQRRAADSQFELAQDQYNRQLPLYRDSILSALEFQSVRAQLSSAQAEVARADAGIAQAQAQLAQASATLANTRITAPFSGRVEERFMERGETASPGMNVVRIVAAGRVEIEAGVPERYANEIQQGAAVDVSPNAYDAGPRTGRIGFIGSTVNPQTRTFPVRIEVPNSDGSLKPEMIVRLQLARTEITGAITLPLSAVVRDERGTGVLLVDSTPDGAYITSFRPVSIGESSGGQTLILSGLSAGERVVASGRANVNEGERVRIASELSSPIAGR